MRKPAVFVSVIKEEKTEEEQYLKKKTVITLGVIILLLLLFLEGTKVEDVTQTTTTSKQETKKIGMVVNHAKQDHYQEFYYDIMKQYAKEQGVQLVLFDPAGDAEVQKNQVQNLINMQCDCIVIWPVNSEEAVASAKAVKEAGIPCMTANTRMTPEGEQYIQCHVGPSCYEEGTIVAEEMLRQLGEDIKVAEIAGPEGYASSEERTAALIDTLAGTQAVILDSQSGQGNRSVGQQIAEEYLETYPKGELDAIFTYDDNAAYGAWNAVEAAGRQNDVKIYAVAVGKIESLDYVRDGKIAGAVVQSPYFDAEDTLDMAIDLASGRKPEKFENNIETPLLTKETVDALHLKEW